MAEQCYRGLDGHPSELKRIRDVASKLSGSDQYKEEIGYSAEELAEAKNGTEFGPLDTPVPHSPGIPPEGAKTEMIEAGVTSNNSPNPSVPAGRKGY